jgi:Asp-tRNA(Asn)/Glu-tRNA(Gln) amidotransferase C subunit
MPNPDVNELLDKLLTLSRLTLDEGERAEFARKFESLLEFVDAVNRSDIALGVGRAEGAGSLSYSDAMPLRDDAPSIFDWGDGFVHDYSVPRVVGDEVGNEGGDAE